MELTDLTHWRKYIIFFSLALLSKFRLGIIYKVTKMGTKLEAYDN